jgi:hypothetical protein
VTMAGPLAAARTLSSRRSLLQREGPLSNDVDPLTPSVTCLTLA